MTIRPMGIEQTLAHDRCSPSCITLPATRPSKYSPMHDDKNIPERFAHALRVPTIATTFSASPGPFMTNPDLREHHVCHRARLSLRQ